MNVMANTLTPHPRNAEFFDEITGEAWQEFLKSIQTSGVIQPIVITQDGTVVSGHQRLRACQELGIEEIPAIQRTYQDEDAVLKDLIETNIRQRGVDNSNPVKLGRCIRELERIYGIEHGGNHGNQYTEKKVASGNNCRLATQSDLAEDLGVSERQLRNYKKLSELIPEWEEFLDTGMITPTTALALSRQLSAEDQRKVLAELDKETRYSASALQPYIDKLKALESAPPKVVPDEESKRQLIEANRTIKGLQSAETALRSRAENAESAASALSAERDELLQELETIKSQHSPEGYFDELAYAGNEAQEAVDLCYKVQQLLENDLAPILFKRCASGLDHKSGTKRVLNDMVDLVDRWVGLVRSYLSTVEENIIDM